MTLIEHQGLKCQSYIEKGYDQYNEYLMARGLLLKMGIEIPETGVENMDRRTGIKRRRYTADAPLTKSLVLEAMRGIQGVLTLYGVRGSRKPVGYSLLDWYSPQLVGRVEGTVTEAAIRRMPGDERVTLARTKISSTHNAVQDGRLICEYLKSSAEESDSDCLIRQDLETGNVWIVLSPDKLEEAPIFENLRVIGLIFNPITQKARTDDQIELSEYNHGDILFVTVPESVPVDELQAALQQN